MMYRECYEFKGFSYIFIYFCLFLYIFCIFLYIFVYLYIYIYIFVYFIYLYVFLYTYIYIDIFVYLLKLLILKSSNNTCSHFGSNHSLAGCAAKGSAGSSACVSLLLENLDQKEIELHQRHFNAT